MDNLKWDTNKQYERWVFTFFHYDAEDEANIQKLDDKLLKFIIYGHELTQDKQPHLQGYLELNSKRRCSGIKALIDPIRGRKSPIHVEPATNDRECQIRYCSKGHQSKDEYETLGEKGPNYGLNAAVYTQCWKQTREGQGKRNDWHELYEFISTNTDYDAVLREFPDKAIKYSTGIKSAIASLKQSNNRAKLEERTSEMKLWKWQDKLAKELKFIPDERTVIWYADPTGHSGKSLLAKWLTANNKGDVAYFTNAKTADICHSYNGERIVIFDFARSNEDRINYGAIEQVKNGLIFSSKYDSCVKINDCPHVICFANFHPDKSKMSADRWDIRHISDDDKTFIESEISDSNQCAPQSTIDSHDAQSAVTTEVPVLPNTLLDSPEPSGTPSAHVEPHLDPSTLIPTGATETVKFKRPPPKWLIKLQKLKNLGKIDEQRIRMWYDKYAYVNDETYIVDHSLEELDML